MSTATVLTHTSRAEWSRIWTVRSSWVLALVTAVGVVGIGTLIGLDIANDPSAPRLGTNAWEEARPTALFTLFGIVALAVVTATADHGTGGIVPTLQWTPRRGVLFAARLGVIVVTTTLLGLAIVVGASGAVRAIVPDAGLPVDDTGLAGLAFVFATSTLLAVGTGLVLRSTAGGLVTVIALVLVLPMLLAQMPYDWAVDLSARMPGAGAIFLIFGEGLTDGLTAESSRITLGIWAVAAVVAGCWRLLRYDADR
jgi:hypothetical protein